MSYDLSVYLPRALSAAEVEELVSSAGPAVGEVADDGMTVVRGVKRSDCFTVDGPSGVEPEDVPHEVVAAVLNASTLYLVVVKGSAEVEVPHAVQFARRIAREFSGAAVDEQSGQVWAGRSHSTSSRGSGRSPAGRTAERGLAALGVGRRRSLTVRPVHQNPACERTLLPAVRARARDQPDEVATPRPRSRCSRMPLADLRELSIT